VISTNLETHIMNTQKPRYDIYRLIHKALRECMGEVLTAVGRMDPDDNLERAAALARVREMLAFCSMHLKKEDEFVHTAMELRAPGSSQHTLGDHAHHLESFQDLEAATIAVETSDAGARAAAAHSLYRKLGLFVGENFSHMYTEETANNEVLWRTYADSELVALENAIVASATPQEKAFSLRWMLPAISPAERAALLNVVRPNLPPTVFADILNGLQARLSESNWEKLCTALAVPALAA